MRDVFVAGVSMTPFGKHLERSLKSLTAEAFEGVLEDAGASTSDIQAAFFGNCVQGHMEGQDMVRGEIALRACGLARIPVVNVENACATAATAFHLAVNYVRAGAADIVLAIGAEKMFATDKARMFSAFDGAWDVHTAEANRDTLVAMGDGVAEPPGSRSERPYSVFMDVYAGLSRLHNPRAQYQRPFTVEEVLAAPPITYPLTLPMCSPVSDGAAAAIVCSAEGLKRLNARQSRAQKVLASVLQTGGPRAPEDYLQHVTRLAADRAYAEAGVGPTEVSVVEVHDATAMGEIIEVEALQLCGLGESGPAAERGDLSLGGRIPVNPSGGLECKGHPIGATGLGQIYELVTQLRGEAGARQVNTARIALAQNGGGIIGVEEAVVAVTLLGHP